MLQTMNAFKIKLLAKTLSAAKIKVLARTQIKITVFPFFVNYGHYLTLVPW